MNILYEATVTFRSFVVFHEYENHLKFVNWSKARLVQSRTQIEFLNTNEALRTRSV